MPAPRRFILPTGTIFATGLPRFSMMTCSPRPTRFGFPASEPFVDEHFPTPNVLARLCES
jgi:hypothetical protein